MTPDQIEMAKALVRATFVPGTATKRFAKDMAGLAEHSPEKELTPKQAKYLYDAVHRFRRQIPPSIVAKAQAARADQPGGGQ